jgi:hypothetical protein
MNMRNCLLSLVVVGTAVGLTALPASAESKLSQCKRFSQTMDTFGKQIWPPLKQTMASKTPETYINSLDKTLAASQKGLKQIEGRRFSDRQLQSLQVQTINLYTDVHNSLVGVANAFDNRDRAGIMAAVKPLNSLAERETKLVQQFRKYCSKP